MIINKMSGGSSSNSDSTRTVGLGEIYFPNVPSQYTTYGYRAFSPSSTTIGHIFSFPGKVLSIDSFKYKIKTSSGGELGTEQTFTGNWCISGNQASPYLSFSANRYYVPTELVALVEDSVSGGSVETVTITASDTDSEPLYKKSSGNNIIGFSGIPENVAYRFGNIKICGKLLDIRSIARLSSDIQITLKLSANVNQGTTFKDEIIRLTQSSTSLTVYLGFDPTFVVVSKCGESGAPDNSGLIAGAYTKPGFPLANNYNSLIEDNSNSLGQFRPISVTYTDSTGSISIRDSSTYPSSFYSGSYHITAMK